MPHRGQVCEPAFTADTARFVARLRGIEVEALSAVTTQNFHGLFRKAQGAGQGAQT
jgi:TatD DNase family protein